jgi:hypothetical protein
MARRQGGCGEVRRAELFEAASLSKYKFNAQRAVHGACGVVACGT